MVHDERSSLLSSLLVLLFIQAITGLSQTREKKNMCSDCQNEFCGKAFIEVPDSFIGLAEIQGADYQKVLNRFMKSYFSAAKRKFKGKEICINELGEIGIYENDTTDERSSS